MSSYREQVEAWEQTLRDQSEDGYFVSLHTLMSIAPPERPPLTRQATDEELAALDWETLVQLQPDLGTFYTRCFDRGPFSDALDTEKGHWSAELQRELTFLVGRNADSSDPLVRSREAFDLARDVCWFVATGQEWPG